MTLTIPAHDEAGVGDRIVACDLDGELLDALSRKTSRSLDATSQLFGYDHVSRSVGTGTARSRRLVLGAAIMFALSIVTIGQPSELLYFRF